MHDRNYNMPHLYYKQSKYHECSENFPFLFRSQRSKRMAVRVRRGGRERANSSTQTRRRRLRPRATSPEWPSCSSRPKLRTSSWATKPSTSSTTATKSSWMKPGTLWPNFTFSLCSFLHPSSKKLLWRQHLKGSKLALEAQTRQTFFVNEKKEQLSWFFLPTNLHF